MNTETNLPHTIFPSSRNSFTNSPSSEGDCEPGGTGRNVSGTRRKLGDPLILLFEVSCLGNKQGQLTHSGSAIFCKLEKKSLLRMVDADNMLPDLFTTTCVTSSGSATPSFASARSRGFNASIPSPRSSFSKVLITFKSQLLACVQTEVGEHLPGLFLT